MPSVCTDVSIGIKSWERGPNRFEVVKALATWVSPEEDFFRNQTHNSAWLLRHFGVGEWVLRRSLTAQIKGNR